MQITSNVKRSRLCTGNFSTGQFQVRKNCIHWHGVLLFPSARIQGPQNSNQTAALRDNSSPHCCPAQIWTRETGEQPTHLSLFCNCRTFHSWSCIPETNHQSLTFYCKKSQWLNPFSPYTRAAKSQVANIKIKLASPPLGSSLQKLVI